MVFGNFFKEKIKSPVSLESKEQAKQLRKKYKHKQEVSVEEKERRKALKKALQEEFKDEINAMRIAKAKKKFKEGLKSLGKSIDKTLELHSEAVRLQRTKYPNKTIAEIMIILRKKRRKLKEMM